MASRAVQLCFLNAQPTYNDNIILTASVAFMEGGSVYIEDLVVTVGIADTINQISAALAAGIRARAPGLGLSPIGTNDVMLLALNKS